MPTLILILLILDTLLAGVIAAFHIYWSFGGTLFADRVLPEYKHHLRPGFEPFNPKTDRPGTLSFLMVIGAFVVYIALLWLNHLNIWQPLITILLWCATAVFALRAIGDFNVLGLFKREKDTLFGRWDTRLYTPICLWLAVTTALQVI